MKITIFIGGLSGGGAERVVCNLANYLAAKKNSVEIITMSEDTPVTKLSEGISVFPFLRESERKNKLYNFILRYRRIKGYVRGSDTEIYLVMLPVTTLLLLHFKRFIKVPVIYSERNDPKVYPAYIKFLLKRYIKRAQGAVFQTEEARDWYRSVYSGKSVIIPNAINPEFIKEPYKGERKKEIVAAGRMTEQKNFSLLISAFSDISGDYPEYRLVIYGEGNRKDEYIRLAEKLGISEKVSFPGYVADIGEKIADASLFVLSSDYEGMPNALMEAMALGLPCISTDCPCGGPRFLIKDGVNGLLVPVGDREALGEAMRKILDSPFFALSCASNAQDICKTLAPDKIYGEWEKYITAVAADGK